MVGLRGGRHRRGSAGVERKGPAGNLNPNGQRATESRTPTSKKANRVTPFVLGISALRELLDKTMSKTMSQTEALSE